VAREIAEIDPFLKVTCYTDGLTEQNMDDFFCKDGTLDLLIEESDGFDIKILSRFKARALKVPVLMEASDRCMVDVERFDLEPSREILHGIVRELDVEKLKSLKTNEEKIPYMLDVLGIETTSPRLKASMVEMHQTVSTWPQLASAVTMGGGITADVARRILLDLYKGSGRFHIDIEELIGDKAVATLPGKNETDSMLSDDDLKNLASPYFRPGVAMDEQHLLTIMEAAAAAPSFGNQQPWKWVQSGSTLVLFDDPAYSFLIDAKKTGMWLSLGCALQNVVTMAESLEYEVQAEYLPGGKTRPVAVLHFTVSAAAASGAGSLAPMIARRHTHRGKGVAVSLQPAIMDELRTAVEEEGGAVLKLVTDEEKIRKVAEMNATLERIRLLHPALNQELFEKELIMGKNAADTGIGLSQLQLSQNMETMVRLVRDPRVAHLLWQWNQGSVFEKESYNIVSQSSAIGMISMPDDSVQSLLKGGMAAERLWLTATKLNLGLQPICLSLLFSENNPKIKESRVSVAMAAGSEMLNERLSIIFDEIPERKAVFLFRMFGSAPVSPALKKNISEIFLTC
jgi:hypothetical protein